MTAQEAANFQPQYERKHKFTPWEYQVLNTSLEPTSGRKRANFKFLNAVRISVSFNFKQRKSLPRGTCLTETDLHVSDSWGQAY